MDANGVAIQRYENAHERMRRNGVPIPSALLTGYIRALRTIRQMAMGDYYTRKLIVVGCFSATPTEFHAIFQAAVDNGWEIESR